MTLTLVVTPIFNWLRGIPTMPLRARPSSYAWLALVAGVGLLASAACSSGDGATPLAAACTDGARVLNVGFYAYFAPVSASAGDHPASPEFDEHVGFEADLLTALEAMEGAGLALSRHAIADWPGIWLLSAGPEYDIVGGGITILDSRRYDPSGEEVVVFTSGHLAFRQSLLVRAGDEGRFPDHGALTSAERVGVLAGTTGEARFLQLTGLADADGVLIAGVRVETASGEVVADGGAGYFITAAGAAPALEGRRRLIPPSLDMPQVIYLGAETGETELFDALADGAIDAIARGEIGNRDAARASRGAFVVTAPGLRCRVGWLHARAGRRGVGPLHRCEDRLPHRQPPHRLCAVAGGSRGVHAAGRTVGHELGAGVSRACHGLDWRMANCFTSAWMRSRSRATEVLPPDAASVSRSRSHSRSASRRKTLRPTDRMP